MKTLAALYFSGTGNTKYAVQKLCAALGAQYACSLYDIADGAPPLDFDVLLFAFPVYGSAPPAPMRRFLYERREQVRGKDSIVVATQYMFSGDGAASLGRAIEKYGGTVRYAAHFRMPNNISDCRVFSVRNGDDLRPLLRKTDARIQKFAARILAGKPYRQGFSLPSRALGYCSQRALFRKHEKSKYGKLSVDATRCVGCGACVQKCPVKNLTLRNGKAHPQNACALCYRCVNLCPKKAVTLLGKRPPDVQYKGVPD